ncbi:MAG: hemolysin family protein [Planctomycetota bacterium]
METLLSEWPRLLLAAALLAGSALFAGAETAFFSLTSAEVRRLKRGGGLLPNLAGRLRSSPRPLLISLLLGNLAVNVGFFSLAIHLAGILADAGEKAISFAISPLAVLLIILIGEYLPKGFALHRPVRVAERTSVPIALFSLLILPVRIVLDAVVAFATRLFGGERMGGDVMTAEELKAFVRLTGESGRLGEDVRDMLEDVIDLGEIRVKEVMVPRVDMVAMDLSAGRDELLDLARRERVSKVVVYEESRDRVRGYVAVKDLLYRPDEEVRELVRDIAAVPETKTAESLLKEMRADRVALALVVDEYGGTEGIATPEDILEEIVGEISDEYDEEKGLARRVAPGVHLVPGDTTLREWEEYAGSELPPGKYDTVGGFVTASLDRIPRPGETVRAEGFRLTVLRVRRGRVLSLIADRHGEGGP